MEQLAISPQSAAEKWAPVVEISEAKPQNEERDGYRVWSISTPEKTKPAASTAGL